MTGEGMSMINSRSQKKNGDRPLTLKQHKFAMEYLFNGGNGLEAAKAAGYTGNERTLKAIASQNLTKLNLKKFLAELRDQMDRESSDQIMCRSEILSRMSRIARGDFDFGANPSVTHLLKKTKLEIEALVHLGKHHGLWTDEIDDPDEVLSRLLGIPKALLPTKLDDANDVIEGDVVDESEERSLTVARKSTTLPAHMALDANKEANHDVRKRPEPELPQPHMSPSEKVGELDEGLKSLNQQLTDGPSNVELMRQDEKAPVENALQGYKRLNREKGSCP